MKRIQSGCELSKARELQTYQARRRAIRFVYGWMSFVVRIGSAEEVISVQKSVRDGGSR
jgi:hypothetical protein